VGSDSSMCPGVDSASENEYQVNPGGKGGRCVKLTTYHPHVPMSRNLGALTSWNHVGLFRPVMGQLFFSTQCSLTCQGRRNREVWKDRKRSKSAGASICNCLLNYTVFEECSQCIMRFFYFSFMVHVYFYLSFPQCLRKDELA
jgi:hypothetical protein